MMLLHRDIFTIVTRLSYFRGKRLLFLFFLLNCFSSISELKGQDHFSTGIGICSNIIRIAGATNLNRFELEQEVASDVICGPGNSNWIFLPGQKVYLIAIPVRDFTANNKMVYRDFLEMVNASSHPYISITMAEEEFLSLYNGMKRRTTQIGVTVAGVTMRYDIPCLISNCANNRIAIRGTKSLKLTDFKLDPPGKTLGLIRVQDQLIINFEFSLPAEPGIKLTHFEIQYPNTLRTAGND